MAQPGKEGLELRLLGPLEVLRDGAPVTLGGAKPRALLAVLALEPGRVVSVDRLVEDLWPGDTPDTAAHAVQVYVSQLRKALGTTAIARRPPGYALEIEPEAVDVQRFLRLSDEGREALQGGDPAAAEGTLRRALGLWRGSALADFLYEPFAQNEIARLEKVRTVVLEERIDADLALGRHAELVPELEALVTAQPLREHPRAQLMLALYRSGRQADALAAYRNARETLVEELGIDPGPELKSREAAVLRQDESLLLAEDASAKPAMQFRRLVTVLFVDVVESLALAGALDPEALRRVLERYFEMVSARDRRAHGGTVEKYIGDAVMGAFGMPVSHEDDALRAARAAVDVRTGLAALNQQLERSTASARAAHRPRHRRGLRHADGRPGNGSLPARPSASPPGSSRPPGRARSSSASCRTTDRSRRRARAAGRARVKGKRSRCARTGCSISAAAPAFEQRLDAPLVGRRRARGAADALGAYDRRAARRVSPSSPARRASASRGSGRSSAGGRTT